VDMRNRAEGRRSDWRNRIVSTVGIVVLPVLVPLSIVPLLRAQSSQATADRPAFEVASVKPLAQGNRNFRFGFQPGGRFVSTVPLQAAISFAYDLPFNLSPRLTGGPDWIRSQDAAYDIEATGVFPDGLSDKARTDRERLMVQALLADRFKLAIHRETKEMPVYGLAVAKGGPKLQKADIDEKGCPDSSASPPPDPTTLCHSLAGGRGRGIHARAVTISELVSGMQNWTDRPLVDKTGIKGLYHIETTGWLPMQVGPPPAPGAKAEDGSDQSDLPTIFDVFEKLGLKMKPQKDKVDTYVIDHIERPSEN
jgi:uncharacterized protein (TIGR03435 family)